MSRANQHSSRDVLSHGTVKKRRRDAHGGELDDNALPIYKRTQPARQQKTNEEVSQEGAEKAMMRDVQQETGGVAEGRGRTTAAGLDDIDDDPRVTSGSVTDLVPNPAIADGEDEEEEEEEDEDAELLAELELLRQADEQRKMRRAQAEASHGLTKGEPSVKAEVERRDSASGGVQVKEERSNNNEQSLRSGADATSGASGLTKDRWDADVLFRIDHKKTDEKGRTKQDKSAGSGTTAGGKKKISLDDVVNDPLNNEFNKRFVQRYYK